MSRQNLDATRRGYEAFARGDLEYLVGMMDPEIEGHTLEVAGLPR
jgi:ketosteroid isomerase-like protein